MQMLIRYVSFDYTVGFGGFNLALRSRERMVIT